MMCTKRVILIFLVGCFAVGTQSCFKHRRQIRVKNSYSTPIAVVVGPADFGSVGSVKTTEYKDIPKGKNEISGDVQGSITVPNGKHKYTLNINTAGIITLIEDTK